MSISDAETIYTLSPVQEAVLLNEVGRAAYTVNCVQARCVLSGSLEVSAFKMAWQQAVSDHQLLRAFFVWKELEQPVQVVHKQLPISLAQQDWREIPRAAQGERLRELIQTDREQRIDISLPPLMRLTLCRTAEDQHQFIWSYHLLVLDSLSSRMVLKEVFDSYADLCQGKEPRKRQHRPYRDYVAWLKQQKRLDAESFWRDNFQNFTSPTPLAVDRASGNWQVLKPEYDHLEVAMSVDITTQLRSLIDGHAMTLNTLIQAAWALLLSRYSDEEEVVFGTRIAGRPSELPWAESMVGPFAHTLPFRASASPRKKVLDWLQEIESQQTEGGSYQYNSLEQVRRWIDVPQGLPLFESGLALDHNPTNDFTGAYAGIQVQDMQSTSYENLAITLQARLNAELTLQVIYDKHRFDQETITRMLNHLQTIVADMVTDPEKRLRDVRLLDEQEQYQLLIEPNETNLGYPPDQCVHSLFEAQVERSPDIDAVVFNSERLNYRDLNQRSNQLARYLQTLGVRPEVRVGICVERCLEMLVGIIGILKAGGAYVPLDPSYPFERLAFMLEDAQASVLLTQERLAQNLPSHSGKVVCLDSDWKRISEFDSTNPVSNVRGDNLAYVIYTSGSTGTPKGVMVTHRGICNTSEVMVRVYGLPPGTRMLQFASLSFDMAVFDIVPAIISGGTLCLAPQNPVMGAELISLLLDQKIQVLTLPPSVLATLPLEELPDLQFIRVAGEAISTDLAETWATGRRFYNAYGPAEGSVWVTGAFLDGTGNAVIGRPISNTKIYLLNSQQIPVPIGVPGELCIGGISVSRGYLNRPETTADKFIPDPFSDEPGRRLYRTGDLARYCPNGDLEFLGRTDHQIKLHGFRIELGEIESLLRTHPSVREAAAQLREDVPGNKRLVGYVLPKRGENPTPVDLRDFLSERLPTTMTPTAFIILDELPLTPNGKLDRRALPAPDNRALETKAAYVAPRNQIEKGLAVIWAEVLGRERISIHDNFFDLGGHSLLATQVVSRVRSTFNIELTLPSLFEATTVAQIAKLIAEAKVEPQTSKTPILPVSRDRYRMKSSALNKTRSPGP